MAKTIVVVLGGQEYAVAQRPIKPSALWRARLETELAPLVELLQQYDQIEINNVGELVSLAQRVGPTLLHGPELAFDLLFAYAVELEPYRGEIEEAAYDDEVLAALWKVVAELAYPFGSIQKQVAAISANGSAAAALTPTLPS
jgi:hypothetical protein